MKDLDEALLAAHQRGNATALVALYTQAADMAQDPQAAAFYLTQAHVFACETAHPETSTLRQRLIAQGREAPLGPAPVPLSSRS